MTKALAIFWFRQDLRLNDNPALLAAAAHGRVLPVYILDDEAAGEWQMGAASRWWLHHSLEKLNESLGGTLWLLHGDASKLIPQLAREHGASLVTWNRCYEPWRIVRDTQLKSTLRQHNVPVLSSNGSCLIEPGSLVKQDQTPYKVFTPYYRQAMQRGFDTSLAVARAKINYIQCTQSEHKLRNLQLLPAINRYKSLQQK